MTDSKSPNTDLLDGQHVENRLTGDLKPYDRNARTHSSKQIQQIAKSIETFGFINPILVDGDSVIIAGHGRWEAAKLLGMTEVPTIRVVNLTEEEKQAYILTDNRLAELAGWDKEILSIELQHLLNIDTQFDINVIGFETAEIDMLIQDVPPDLDLEDALPELDEDIPIVSQPGDCWRLGDHALICGDARDQDIYSTLMGNEQARVLITDPPYNVPIHGHVRGHGKASHSEFAMASGEMSVEGFTRFLTGFLVAGSPFLVDGALLYVFMDWRHISELLSAAKQAQLSQVNLCVWNKYNGGMGSFYRSKHELVFVFKLGKAPHVNNIELGKYGRYRTNVWDCPGANSFHQDRDEALEIHPTVKPVALIADAILDSTHHGEIVLDPFGGSGTTLLAAERVGRRARLIEIEPRYVDVAIRRWQNTTGKHAIHTETGLAFEDLAQVRCEPTLPCVSSTTTAEVRHGE
ncbi:MAG: DNA methyltransferase [Sedimenticola sp.]